MADARLIVADTGPLISLAHVDAVEVLRHFYSEILIPPAVADELAASRVVVAHEILSRNEWITRHTGPTSPDLGLRVVLDRGEAEAIRLAVELHAAVLIDE